MIPTGTNYQINGTWLPIIENKMSLYYAILYVKKVDTQINIVNYSGSYGKDSLELVNRIMNSVSEANYNIDTLKLQVLKLNYVIKSEEVVSIKQTRSEKLMLNELNLLLPKNSKWVKIYDSRGHLKMNKNIQGEKFLNLESLKNGLYFIQTNNKPSQKLIIEK